MNDRFEFRLPFYNNKGEFSHFEFILIGESLPAYNAGVMFHRGEYEQCTGLQDENGNLIYIGDIIKCGERTATVSYANDENLIDGIYPFNLYHDCGDECHCQLRDFPEYACEIIGNIHEQAEQKDVK